MKGNYHDGIFSKHTGVIKENQLFCLRKEVYNQCIQHTMSGCNSE